MNSDASKFKIASGLRSGSEMHVPRQLVLAGPNDKRIQLGASETRPFWTWDTPQGLEQMLSFVP